MILITRYDRKRRTRMEGKGGRPLATANSNRPLTFPCTELRFCTDCCRVPPARREKQLPAVLKEGAATTRGKAVSL